MAGLVLAVAAILVLATLLILISSPLDLSSAQSIKPEVVTTQAPTALPQPSTPPPPPRVISPQPKTAPAAAVPTPSSGKLSLKGTVRTPDRNPISGAQIQVRLRGRPAGEATSDHRGEFEIPMDQDGSIDIEVTHDSYSKVDTKRNRIPPNEIDIVMQPGGTISGVVLSDWSGEPIPNAPVRVGNGTGEGPNRRKIDRGTRTGPDGSWTMQGLPPDTYSVAASARGFAVGSLPGPVSVVAGDVVSNLIIRLSPESALSGRVVDDATNQPVRGAAISFQPAYPAGPRRASSNAEGKFELKGVSPGRATIQASARGYMSRWVSGLNVSAGQTLENVEIRLQRPGSSLDPGHQSGGRAPRMQYAGIGARLRSGEDGPVIVNTFDGGPASNANLAPGDEVLSVDGVSLRGKPLQEATELIKGTEGQSVRLQVRGADGRMRYVNPVRSLLQI